MTQAEFKFRRGNPDVLTSIANLSNDEVFTPPEFANRMLDTLQEAWASSNNGANIWEDSSVTFLDPFTKSGVFLREITERLTHGLAKEIPDLQERVNHILTKQVFGIGITQLTALIARRSVYCSKWANGEHSIATAFENEDGNIWYQRTEHTWVGGKDKVIVINADGVEETQTTDGKCKYCGAPRKIFGRGDSSESYAYFFTHSDDITTDVKSIFGEGMKFDVVIGNPPYQMAGGAGGSSDASIYQHFVEQAQKLEPRYLSMVIPARWLAGGRDMGSFRDALFNGGKLHTLIDYPVSKEVFPGVDVMGGICYFLWDLHHDGPVEYTLIRGEEIEGPKTRELAEFDVFVRSEIAVEILRKVLAKNEPSITEILTADTPFGISTNFKEFNAISKPGDLSLFYVDKGKRNIGYVARNTITKNQHLIDSWKVLAPEAYGGQSIPDSVIGKPQIAPPESVCTQTFLAFFVESESEAMSLLSYYETRFFRFLVSLRKITQHALRATYTWVPQQNWDREWTDGQLFEKYGFESNEIAFIESRIRAMGVSDE